MFWQNAYAGTISLPQASTMAASIDNLHDFLYWLSLFFTVLVTILMVVLVKKYHNSKKGRKTEYILDNHKLEATWTIVPLILMLGIFAWGYVDYLKLRQPLPDAHEINVIGRQWMWNFEYPNGKKTLNELYLPKGPNVKLIMTAEDVLHSFFVPNFRLKQDVVPGMYTTISFEITETGIHPVYCTEFCGTGHSDMLAYIIAMEPADYDKWLKTGVVPVNLKNQLEDVRKKHTPPPYMSGTAKTANAKSVDTAKAAASASTQAEGTVSMAEKGRAIFQAKGCFACHTTDGTVKIGPSLLNSFGRTEEMADGTKVKVDENYIRESLMEPNKKILKGFSPTMPTFKGLVNDEEMNAIIAYIKSLKK